MLDARISSQFLFEQLILDTGNEAASVEDAVDIRVDLNLQRRVLPG